MERHSVDYFIHILEHGRCLDISVIGYTESHSPFQTSIVIKILMSKYYRNLMELSRKESIESLQNKKFNSNINSIEEISVKMFRDISTQSSIIF